MGIQLCFSLNFNNVIFFKKCPTATNTNTTNYLVLDKRIPSTNTRATKVTPGHYTEHPDEKQPSEVRKLVLENNAFMNINNELLVFI